MVERPLWVPTYGRGCAAGGASVGRVLDAAQCLERYFFPFAASMTEKNAGLGSPLRSKSNG